MAALERDLEQAIMKAIRVVSVMLSRSEASPSAFE
jgi:hypothetical protein